MSATAPATATTVASTLHPQKRAMLWINGLGGIAVLGSYAHGILTHPLTRGDAWGGVPAALEPLYTLNMLLAAAGYFLFTYFVFFRLDPDRVRVSSRSGFGAFNTLYALIMISAALWMPLTFAMLEAPGTGLWIAIRGVLAITGLASVGLFVAIASVRPHEAPLARRLALVGCAAFCLQTAVLDALVWPFYFPF
jgi:hypothetical protein